MVGEEFLLTHHAYVTRIFCEASSAATENIAIQHENRLAGVAISLNCSDLR